MVCDPFNESMSSQIYEASIEPPPAYLGVEGDAMHEAIDSVELNPPNEFLDAITWDASLHGSGSMMSKFAVVQPYPSIQYCPP